jgi:hypothetical protein
VASDPSGHGASGTLPFNRCGPFALRVGDIKFVTHNSAETVAYSDFLELHNTCTSAAEHDVSGPDRGRSSERKLLIPNTRRWNRAIC